jgi:hypothetical protein
VNIFSSESIILNGFENKCETLVGWWRDESISNGSSSDDGGGSSDVNNNNGQRLLMNGPAMGRTLIVGDACVKGCMLDENDDDGDEKDDHDGVKFFLGHAQLPPNQITGGILIKEKTEKRKKSDMMKLCCVVFYIRVQCI